MQWFQKASLISVAISPLGITTWPADSVVQSLQELAIAKCKHLDHHAVILAQDA